jgi:hypothetical protein
LVIFFNHKSLNSFATGQKILFHIGLISHLSFLVINTTALSPNLIYVPSFLGISFLTLTTIALVTCHFFILPFGVVLFIATTTLSHTVAVFPVEPLRILIICAFFAHVLSATTTTDSFFNIYNKFKL